MALPAHQEGPEVTGTTLGGHDPRAQLPGWGVPHVLAMSTLQLRDPVVVCILSKPDDAALDHPPSCQTGV